MRRKPRLVRKVHVVGMVAIWLAAGGLLSQEPDFSSFPELFVSPRVERAVCGRSQRCRVVWIRSAGKNFAGDSLDVVRIARLGPAKWEGVGEVWLVTRRGSAVVRRQLLSRDGKWHHTDMREEVTNHDPGFRVTRNHYEIALFSYHDSLGTRFAMQLDPLRPLVETRERSAYARGGAEFDFGFRQTWDWQRFVGLGESQDVALCHPGQGPDHEPFTGQDSPFLLIPLVEMEPRFVQAAWRSVWLGSCAVEVGGDKAPGFLLDGWRDETKHAPVMKLVLISPRDLLVEIPSVVFEAGGANWLFSDHIEIWQTAVDSSAVQWGVRLSDGKVFRGHNNPKDLPTAERVIEASNKSTLWKIHLAYPVDPQPESLLSVSLSASGGGSRVAFMLSTSEICFGRDNTLSMVKALDRRLGKCGVELGQLNWHAEPMIKPNEPLVDLTGD